MNALTRAHPANFQHVALWLLAPVVAFALMAGIGIWAQQFRAPEPPVPLIWPAAGIALALIYRWGAPTAIGVALGATWAHAELGNPWAVAGLMGLLTGLSGIISARVLRRLHFDQRLKRVRDALILLGVGLGLTAVLSAAGGTLVLTGLSPAFPHTFGLCWIADAMGMVLLAPPLIAIRLPRTPEPRDAEAALWIGLGAVFVYGVYAGALSPPAALAASYAVFPLILAVALRFGAATTGTAVAAIAVVALVCTGLGTGPFAQVNMLADMLSLHAHLAMLGVTGLVFASARSERDAADERARENLGALARAGRLDAMSSMAAGIAHEINQPLSAVNSYAQAAQRMLRDGRSGDDVADALQRVVTGNERAAAIVRRVRTFLRSGDEERRLVDLNELVCEAVDLAAPEFRRERVQLVTDRASQPLLVRVDAVAIRQVVVNLLQNALEAVGDATADGPGEVRVSTRGLTEDMWAEVTVADNGPGLPDSDHNELFEPLVTQRTKGTGLGLSIVRSLVESHAGTVEAHNGDTGGAVFTVRLSLEAHKRKAA